MIGSDRAAGSGRRHRRRRSVMSRKSRFVKKMTVALLASALGCSPAAPFKTADTRSDSASPRLVSKKSKKPADRSDRSAEIIQVLHTTSSKLSDGQEGSPLEVVDASAKLPLKKVP